MIMYVLMLKLSCSKKIYFFWQNFLYIERLIGPLSYIIFLRFCNPSMIRYFFILQFLSSKKIYFFRSVLSMNGWLIYTSLFSVKKNIFFLRSMLYSMYCWSVFHFWTTIWTSKKIYFFWRRWSVHFHPQENYRKGKFQRQMLNFLKQNCFKQNEIRKNFKKKNWNPFECSQNVYWSLNLFWDEFWFHFFFFPGKR